jgi:drug/metabolite transporter (DMT)-like permease
VAFGELAALGDAVFWASTGVTTRRLGRHIRPVHLSAVLATASSAALVLISAASGQVDDILRTPAWSLGLFAGGAVLGALGMLTFFMTVSTGTLGATYTTTSGLYILFSMVAGILVLDDSAKPVTFAGAAAIIAGLYLLNSRPAAARGTAVENAGADPSAPPRAGRRLFPPPVLRRLNPARPGAGGPTLAWLGLATLTAALWSVDLIASARGLERAGLLANGLVHQLVPATLFGTFVALTWRSNPAKVARGDVRKLALAALFYVGSTLTWNYALDNADAGITALLASTSPVFALLLAAAVLRERLSPVALAGAGLAFAGIVTVVTAK